MGNPQGAVGAAEANRLDVFCVADLCVDLILTGNVRPRFLQVEQLIGDYRIELGGSATIFASQFVKLGGRAGVLGWVGEDAFGDLILGRLQELGVDESRVRRHSTLKTGLGVALAEPEDRAILTYSGTIDTVRPEELTDDLLSSCRHWHIASYFLLTRLRDCWPGWLQRLRAAGVTTSLDTNWDPAECWEGVTDLLTHVDVFLPNEAEALAITGQPDVFAAGRALAAQVPLVAIKRGKEGAIAFDRRGEWQAASSGPGADERPIVDTIGAGDNFDAGFVRAWLLGWSVDDCLGLGIRCARASLGAAGGIEGQLVEVSGAE